MASINLLDPKTGRTGSISPDNVARAIQDGYQITDPVDVFDQASGKTGTVKPEDLPRALQDGYVPVGSHAHQVATTGKLESALRGGAQGASLGFADEITGLLESIFTDKKYAQARDESRANYDTAREANPLSYTAGELGGGLALPLPGVGGLLKPGAGLIAKLAAETGIGAGLGAASSLGNSRADLMQGQIGQAASDTLHGAELGGALGLGGGIVARGVSASVNKVGSLLHDAVDPTTQTLLAAGATPKNFMGPLGDKSKQAADIAKKVGLFERTADGSLPELEEIFARIKTKRVEAADQLHDLFAQVGNKTLDVRTLDNELTPALVKIVEDAPPDMRAGLAQSLNRLRQDVFDTGGSLSELWALKKRSGGWVGPTWDKIGQPPPLKEGFMKLNSTLEEALHNATEQFAATHGLQNMRQLNDTYGAMSTLEKVVEPKIARGITKDPFNARLRDMSVFSVGGSALGGTLGGGIGAAIGGAAGGVIGQSLSSTSGRLLRARVGEQIHAAQQQAATVMGYMPRTTTGIQKFLSERAGQLTQAYPQFSQQIQQIIAAPPSAAENMIRMALPILTPFLAPSTFSSELDGKVSSEQDKMMARKMLDKMHMPPSEAAHSHSVLSKDGTLHQALFAPPDGTENQPDDPIADQVAAFSQRLETMYNGR